MQGKFFDAMGWFNNNSIEGISREKAFQVQRYLSKEFPHRDFIVTFDDKGMCVKSFDMLHQAKYKDNPIAAYLPVWNDDTMSAQFKVW